MKLKKFFSYTRLSVFSIIISCALVICLSGCSKKGFLRKKKHAFPVDKGNRIALILDDAGNTGQCLFDMEKMDFPVTIAVLPSVAYTQRYLDLENPLVKKIVHLPMEAGRLYPGPETLYTSMNEEEIALQLEKIFRQYPGIKGFNNHMGSVFMQDRKGLETVFVFAKEKELFFLNSMTVNDKTAGELSEEKGIPYLARDIFLDNKAEEDYIRERFHECLVLAEKKSLCIVIGHVRPLTLKLLQELVPEARKQGFSFVFLEDLYKK